MKSIIIIGAGIAGLSAGVYAARNGYDVTLYELHYLPGGMCTAWRRGGFTFEGCLCFIGLVGSSPAHTYYGLWKELGVVPGTKMIYHDIFHTFQDPSGRTLNIYSDADRLETELLSLSPSDAKEIEALCTAVKQYAHPDNRPESFAVDCQSSRHFGRDSALKEIRGHEYGRICRPLQRSADSLCVFQYFHIPGYSLQCDSVLSGRNAHPGRRLSAG